MPISKKKTYKKSRGRGKGRSKRKSKVVPNYLLIIIDILDNQNLKGENLEYYLSLRQQLLAKPKKVNLIIHKLLKKKEFKNIVPAIIGMNGGGGKKGKSTRREPSKKMRKFHGKYGIAVAREACKEYRGNPRTQCLKSYRNGLLTRCPYNWKNSEGYKQCQDMYSNLIGLSGPQAYRPLPNGPVDRPEQGRYFLKQNPKGPQQQPPKGHVYDEHLGYGEGEQPLRIAGHPGLKEKVTSNKFRRPPAFYRSPYGHNYYEHLGYGEGNSPLLIGKSAGLKANKQRVPSGQPTPGPDALRRPVLEPFTYVHRKPQYIRQGLIPKPNLTYIKPNVTSEPLGSTLISDKVPASDYDLIVPATALLYLISLFANKNKPKPRGRHRVKRSSETDNNDNDNNPTGSDRPRRRNTGPGPIMGNRTTSRNRRRGPIMGNRTTSRNRRPGPIMGNRTTSRNRRPGPIIGNRTTSRNRRPGPIIGNRKTSRNRRPGPKKSRNTGPETDTLSLTKLRVGDTINYSDSSGQEVSASIINVKQADEHRVKTSSKPRQEARPPIRGKKKGPGPLERTSNLDFPPAPPIPQKKSSSSDNSHGNSNTTMDEPPQSQNINPRLKHRSTSNKNSSVNKDNLIERATKLLKQRNSLIKRSRNESERRKKAMNEVDVIMARAKRVLSKSKNNKQ